MGYTHYWRRPLTINPAIMMRIAEDFSKLVLPLDDNGVRLADAMGEGAAEIGAKGIYFNGPEKCGHPPNAEITIPWPSAEAGGIGSSQVGPEGSWFAGVSLQTRCCNGDCSYESFVFPRVMKRESWQTPEDGKYFVCCKTAFRPYDIAVTAALLIAKHHMGEAIKISSDGEDCHWWDAKMLCQTVLGYGLEYQLGETLELAQVAV